MARLGAYFASLTLVQGVELGKVLAKTILAEIDSGKVRFGLDYQLRFRLRRASATSLARVLSSRCQPGSHDSSTTGLLKAYLAKVRQAALAAI